ncbi:hypothetical protein ACF08B_36060 [Streptomyces sp. NPDC015139]|uniref:hypothetical protein n=1 Tax=Streptomyces sp. NPDC015139 TaxID=3364942 RepID=UPI0036F99212
MSYTPAGRYTHVAVPADILATALYALGRHEAAEIESRADGLRPGAAVCAAVAWLWENGQYDQVANLVGTLCAGLRGQRIPGGVGQITHDAVITAFGAELAQLALTPEGGWAPLAAFLHEEVPRGF